MGYVYTETESKGNKKRKKNMESDEAAAVSGVRWGRILPKMVVRILLVEADDSTRHIIAALLRKCSYRVAAVSDGLKAWELLKGNAHNIDLILTEVNLPSISGYALLTLIMEHDVCKNIPIIMMSSHDSIGTVYRCMLRGAADFLVKPVRKNELRNLWQHVWRRQASNGGALGPLHETALQQKACSDHSSTHKASFQRRGECCEISSDSQSSSRKRVLDSEGENTEDVSSSTQQNWNTCLQNDEGSRKEGLCHEATIMLRMSENDAGAARIDANTTTKGGDKPSDRGHGHTSDQTTDDYPTPLQAVDLIGAFDCHLKSDDRSPDSISSRNNVGFSSLLDLSLTRSHPRSSVSQYIDENHRLNHSDASVLRREMPSGQSISPKTSNQQDIETDSNKQFPCHASDNNLTTPGARTTPHNHVPSNYSKSGEVEFGSYSPQKQLQPLTTPVEGVRFEQLRSVYSSMIIPIRNKPSGTSFQNPGSRAPGKSSYRVNPFLKLNCETRSPRELHSLTDQNNSHATNHNEGENRHESESATACQHFVSGTHESANNRTRSGAINHIDTSCATNGNNLVPAEKVYTPAEALSLAHHMKSQREAAVTKFRLKRKDRCFDKKVRYESRKQLAEQRPRVKGQFVRQVPREPL